MKYLNLIQENNEGLKERYELVAERVAQLAKDASDAKKYADYFEKTAQYLVLLNTIVEATQSGKLAQMEEAKGKEINAMLYADILGDAYATSYANPSYAVEQFGMEAGQILTALH
ncbi:MAG: leucyl aminopeptidase, partial [Agathobacter sp.]|nr:leucyl aminopeptidase [Agathobacter sp.]